MRFFVVVVVSFCYFVCFFLFVARAKRKRRQTVIKESFDLKTHIHKRHKREKESVRYLCVVAQHNQTNVCRISKACCGCKNDSFPS